MTTPDYYCAICGPDASGNLTRWDQTLQKCVVPENCEGEWSNWTACSCQNPVKQKTYRITKPGNKYGLPCPYTNGQVMKNLCTDEFERMGIRSVTDCCKDINDNIEKQFCECKIMNQVASVAVNQNQTNIDNVNDYLEKNRQLKTYFETIGYGQQLNVYANYVPGCFLQEIPQTRCFNQAGAGGGDIVSDKLADGQEIMARKPYSEFIACGPDNRCMERRFDGSLPEHCKNKVILGCLLAYRDKGYKDLRYDEIDFKSEPYGADTCQGKLDPNNKTAQNHRAVCFKKSERINTEQQFLDTIKDRNMEAGSPLTVTSLCQLCNQDNTTNAGVGSTVTLNQTSTCNQTISLYKTTYDECKNLGGTYDITKNECKIDNNVMPKDCIMSEWGPWSTCSKSCGTGTKTRTRTRLQENTGSGRECSSDTLSETTPCTENSGCPSSVVSPPSRRDINENSITSAPSTSSSPSPNDPEPSITDQALGFLKNPYTIGLIVVFILLIFLVIITR